MSIRPNPAGQDRYISWGHLGNFRKYKNVAAKDDEKTIEERKQEIFQRLKPYNSEEYVYKAAFVVGGGGVYETTSGATPTPTPTPSITPTSTLTPTPTPTSTLTPTPTPSITPSPSPVFDADATAYLNKVVSTGGTINSTISAATYTMFSALKSNNLWSKLYAFYPHIGGTSASHAVNGKTPDSVIIEYNGGWTFSNAGGSLPNGTNAYGLLKTGALSGVLSQNNTSAGYYSLTNDTNGDKVDMGIRDTNGRRLRVAGYYSSSFRPIYSVNADDNTTSTTNTESSGFYVASRTSSASHTIYKNGSYLLSGATTSTGVPNNEITIGAEHNVGISIDAYSNRAHGFSFVGEGLTDSEVATLSTIVNNFQTSLSRNTY